MSPDEYQRFVEFHLTAQRARMIGALVLFVLVWLAAMWLLY